MNSALMSPWTEHSLIAFDLETSARFPLEGEICEMAAVKWQRGQIVDRFQALVLTEKPMSAEVIAIHNISNEMLVGAPKIAEVIGKFHQFIQGSILIAHHAPFDMGYLACEFERAKLTLPEWPVLCTSLLTRRAIPESPNHRLATLLKHLGLTSGTLHRAMEDAEACLAVALKTFSRIGEDKSFWDLVKYQAKSLYWQDFSIDDLAKSEIYAPLVQACRKQDLVSLTYEGGSRPGTARKVVAIGIVRNPDGDYFVGREENQAQTKRYYLDKILQVELAT